MSIIKEASFELDFEFQQATSHGYFIIADFQDDITYRNKPKKNRRDRREKRALKEQGITY